MQIGFTVEIDWLCIATFLQATHMKWVVDVLDGVEKEFNDLNLSESIRLAIELIK